MPSRNADIDLDFADGTYRFRLAIGQLEELQDKTGVGPFALYLRLRGADWRVADVREPIRLGLIGGGMKPSDALKLVRNYVDNYALAEFIPLAVAIVGAAVLGVPDDQAGKSEAAGTTTETTVAG